MEKQTKNIFFLGKGGVGKSTSSALTALHLSKQGYNTRLVSMDPAHNQSDIFEQKFNEKFKKINSNLLVKEIDIDKWVKEYLEDIHNQLQTNYSYLTAFNLEKYLNLLKYSPGIEEYALLRAYENIRKEVKNVDYIIFDMPPTALTLKFLTLPHISLNWLYNLLDLRNKIIEKKEIISKVKFGKKEIETDKIINKLKQQIENYNNIKNIFSDKQKTILNLVMNTDKLSFAESKLIIKKLKNFNIDISNIFLNKVPENFDIQSLKKEFESYNFQILPTSKIELLGIQNLENYIERLNDFIKF